ncbi:transposase [Colletotrichum incanum]|nr:transposase [Colletotrichum incanum]
MATPLYLRHQPDSQTARQPDSQEASSGMQLCLRSYGQPRGFDEQAYRLAVLERQIQALQSQQDNRRKGKRRAVDPDPNSTFVNIANIRQS